MIDTERLLRIRGLAKTTISRKTRMLHHIYTWVRIVGESSYVLRDYRNSELAVASLVHNSSSRKRRSQRQDQEDVAAETQHGYKSKLDDFLRLEQSQYDSDPDANAEKGEAIGLHDIHLEDSRRYTATMYLQLYGISETWLSLLSQTTRLANVMDSLDASKKRKDLDLLDSLDRRKQRLEDMVCSFVASNEPVRALRPQSNTTAQAPAGDLQLSHETPRSAMVRALNSALVIFFYRRIRDVNPWILQEHVKNVVQALSDFDVCCEIFNVDGPGSPWPVLVAGCEASSQPDRDFFSQWLDRAYSKTGFDRFKTIKSCMREVWMQRKPAGGRRESSSRNTLRSWIHVSREQKIYLLLS